MTVGDGPFLLQVLEQYLPHILKMTELSDGACGRFVPARAVVSLA